MFDKSSVKFIRTKSEHGAAYASDHKQLRDATTSIQVWEAPYTKPLLSTSYIPDYDTALHKIGVSATRFDRTERYEGGKARKNYSAYTTRSEARNSKDRVDTHLRVDPRLRHLLLLIHFARSLARLEVGDDWRQQRPASSAPLLGGSSPPPSPRSGNAVQREAEYKQRKQGEASGDRGCGGRRELGGGTANGRALDAKWVWARRLSAGLYRKLEPSEFYSQHQRLSVLWNWLRDIGVCLIR